MNHEIKNILIVEDDLVFCKLLTKFLEKSGYLAIDSQTALSAMEKMETAAVDLAIIDYRLPDKDGIELLKWIQEKHPGIRSILMSRFIDDSVSVQAKAAGAIGFLTKPFNPEELIQKVEHLDRAGA
jgi:two-component system response regulator HydG